MGGGHEACAGSNFSRTTFVGGARQFVAHGGVEDDGASGLVRCAVHANHVDAVGDDAAALRVATVLGGGAIVLTILILNFARFCNIAVVSWLVNRTRTTTAIDWK